MNAAVQVIRFEDVVLTAGDGTVVLGGIDLELPLRGVTALVGPSGSGKSTLLRMCNRLEVPSRGRVLLDGVDLADLDPLRLRRRVGMVFQRPTLFAGTVRDNCRVADPSADDVRCVEVLARCGLDPGLLDRDAGDLSGGEAQRVCIARTLLTDPEVLLADEITSALDPESRRVMERLVRGLADGPMAVLWVTHDLDQARVMADRIVVLDAGRVAGDEATRRFLGDDGAST